MAIAEKSLWQRKIKVLEAINALILTVMDALLGWSVSVSLDMAVITVAVSTAVLLSVVRVFTTNQNLLERCHLDKKKLRQLASEGRRAKTKAVQLRCKQIKNMIGMKALKQEVFPLVVSIVPIVCIALWCFERLGYHPPRENEAVEVMAYFRVSQVDQLVHLVPENGLSVDAGWVKEIELAKAADGQPYGLASWTVRGSARGQAYRLVFRYGGKKYEHELLVGQETYSTPIKKQGQSAFSAVQLKMRTYRPFGVVGGIRWLGLAPWLVGYLVMVIPLAWLLKRILRIH